MASLKDLRNRIASVKATQKITKAMQMVAAAKLRKAQEAAEAARPYASRMGGVLANLSTAVEGRDGASALMAGTGRQVSICSSLHRRAWAVRRFQLFHRQAGPRACGKAASDGKTVKIMPVGKKGYDALHRKYVI